MRYGVQLIFAIYDISATRPERRQIERKRQSVRARGRRNEGHYVLIQTTICCLCYD